MGVQEARLSEKTRDTQSVLLKILKGIPNFAICFIKVIKVSDAKIIEVNTKIPIINIAIT